MNDTAAKKDVTKLQRTIVDALEDVKAQDIQVFDTEHLSALFERVVVASGTSNRQTKALAASVRDKVREAGFPKPRIEGEDNGEWIIVDCGSAVVHVMQPTIRSYYNLEALWGDKPVRLKLGAPQPLGTDGKNTAKKEAKVNHAGKAPRRIEPEPVKAQMPGRSKKAAAPVAAKTAAKPVAKTAAKSSAKSAVKPASKRTPVAVKTAAKPVATPAAKTAVKTAAKTAAKTAIKTPMKMVKVNDPAKAPKRTPSKSALKPAAKRAPAKKAAARKA
jgi:ribosome-associated protein